MCESANMLKFLDVKFKFHVTCKYEYVHHSVYEIKNTNDIGL